MKKLLTAFISILVLTGLATQASDLVIESKNQTYNEAENKIKFNGNVKVSVDDLKVVGIQFRGVKLLLFYGIVSILKCVFKHIFG